MKYNTFPIKSTRTRHCIWSLIIPIHIILIYMCDYRRPDYPLTHVTDHQVSLLVKAEWKAEGVVVTKCAEIWLQNVRCYKMC